VISAGVSFRVCVDGPLTDTTEEACPVGGVELADAAGGQLKTQDAGQPDGGMVHTEFRRA
jgi:hypothetical protein